MPAPRILVVEDERIVALHLRHQLLSLGYEVPRGAVAKRRSCPAGEYEASPPDLVLMDINLEGDLDGIATAARIPPASRIPIIYLTAYSEDSVLARASATNPYGYFAAQAVFRARTACDDSGGPGTMPFGTRIARGREIPPPKAEKMAALGQLARRHRGRFRRVAHSHLWPA